MDHAAYELCELESLRFRVMNNKVHTNNNDRVFNNIWDDITHFCTRDIILDILGVPQDNTTEWLKYKFYITDKENTVSKRVNYCEEPTLTPFSRKNIRNILDGIIEERYRLYEGVEPMSFAAFRDECEKIKKAYLVINKD